MNACFNNSLRLQRYYVQHSQKKKYMQHFSLQFLYWNYKEGNLYHCVTLTRKVKKTMSDDPEVVTAILNT